MQGNFFIELIARLQKARSEKQIKQDIKSFGDIYVKTEDNKHYLSEEQIETLKEKLEENGDLALQV